MTVYSLQGHNLAAFFNKHPLFENLNFSVASGEILKIIGSNGSGKTTLLRIISSLTFPSSGNIVRNPSSSKNLEAVFVPVTPPLKNNLRVFEQIHFWLLLKGESFSLSQSEPFIKKSLAPFGLQDLWDTPIRYLSAGQRQSLNLCQLCLKFSPIWILDEPFAHLDPQQKDSLRSVIKSHLSQNGLVIMATPENSDNIISKLLFIEHYKPKRSISEHNQW